MSKDLYFKPDNVRIATDFRDSKEIWYIQFNYNNCGISFKISDSLKKQIVNTILENEVLFGEMIIKDYSWRGYFEKS